MFENIIKNKIKSQKEIVQISEELKKQNRKIVTRNGAFDILHSGHILSLAEAKDQGDILIVLLNSDKSVGIYKGPQHPINCQEDRAETLSALTAVDYVVIFNELTPNKILLKIRPDIHCVGSDWGSGAIERMAVEKNGGKIYTLKHIDGKSTSEIIQKISEQTQQPPVKAIFLDRDGIINENQPEYLHRIEDFKFLPGVIEGLKKLSKTEFKIIIVTNQSGIARGYFTENDLEKLHNWMLKFLKDNGVRIDGIYYCPHHPNIGNEKYMKKCNCRKPNAGLILQAAKDFGINLSKSWLIGDNVQDILAGKRANLKTIFLGETKQGDFEKLKILPNYRANNFLNAVDITWDNC
jgi:D-glycero-D-manno-heptose 1,7-bisphosphate phosphatase